MTICSRPSSASADAERVAATLALLLATACASAPAPGLGSATRPSVRTATDAAVLLTGDAVPFVERRAPAMGTEVQIVIVTDDRPRAEAIIDAALAEITRIEELMTDWKESSQLSAINRAAGEAPVHVDRELLDLLEGSKAISALTDGGFDVTYAGAGRFWDFKAVPPKLPDPEDLRRGVKLIDYRRMKIDLRAGTAFLPERGMRIGLGGIAKGYAVDQASDLIHKAGFKDFALKAGGDMRVAGRWNGKLWSVAIRDPRDRGGIIAVLPVSNVAISTSGDYERFFEIDGKRYAHIIDPHTGWPVDHTRSVTIVATEAWLTDGLAKGVFVLGAEKGIALIEKLHGVEAVVVDAQGNLHMTRGLRMN
jgi:thiamine biosynthesis lipoprotein